MTAIVETQLVGADKAIKAFTGAVKDLKDLVARELYEEANLVMADSKANYCPVGQPPEDRTPGTLRNSGFVDPPAWTSDGVVIRLGYGGAAMDYALVQHERLDYHHTVGQAKYLEEPALKAASGIDKRISSKISKLGS